MLSLHLIFDARPTENRLSYTYLLLILVAVPKPYHPCVDFFGAPEWIAVNKGYPGTSRFPALQGRG